MNQKYEKLKENVFFIFFLKAIPVISIMAAILLELAPIRFSYFSFIRPQISIIFVFFWSVYFPESLGYFILFFLGMLSDLLSMNMIGMNALLFLLMFIFLSKYKNYLTNRSFSFVFMVFFGFSFIEMLVKIILISIENNAFPVFTQVFLSYALLLAVYPLIVIFCDKINACLIERNINVDK